MSTTAKGSIAIAGQGGWTRHLARDLFPGRVTPFAWTLLAAPADRALQNTYLELGGQVSERAPFWRLENGYAYLNAAALAEADETLYGAGWLGPRPPQAPGGLRARLKAGGVIKRCQAGLTAAVGQANGLQTRLSRWLAWVQGLKWNQADLLQVMEELEPHALTALQTYFMVRVALNAAGAAFDARLRELLPAFPPDHLASLTLGAPDLPSVATVEAILDASRRAATDPQRLATLARCSHRGPGEMRPDASRWPDAPELLNHLAAQDKPVWSAASAAVRRQQALAVLQRSVKTSEYRQAQELLTNLARTMRAADIAWDALTFVMAAAQRWAGAAARETVTAGLIECPADVLYLELEELKQVATGEWHAGDKDAVQGAVGARLRGVTVPPVGTIARSPVIVCPGACDGPLYCDSPRSVLPPPAAVWLLESADPGSAPFWGFASCLLTSGDDSWSPGMVAARGLGIPARAGVASASA